MKFYFNFENSIVSFFGILEELFWCQLFDNFYSLNLSVYMTLRHAFHYKEMISLNKVSWFF